MSASNTNTTANTPPTGPQPPQQSPSPQAPVNGSKSKFSAKSLFILVGVFILLATVGILWWLHARQFQETDDAMLTGHVHSIAARVSGTVLQVLVKDNEWVHQGETLAILDPSDYQVALSQAQHHLETAKVQAKTAYDNIGYVKQQAISQMTQARGAMASSNAVIIQSQESVQEARQAINQAQQVLNQNDANYRQALSDYQRYKQVDPEAVSAQQIQQISTALNSAAASRASAFASLQEAKARLAQQQSTIHSNRGKLIQSKGVEQGAQAETIQRKVAESQYAAALTEIHQAEDEVRQAQLNLSYTRLLAPISGRVGQKTVESGQRLSVGEPLMAVVSSDVWVVANFKETQLENMKPGQIVDVTVDAFPNHTFEGRVQSFSPASGAEFALLPPENATGNFTKIVQRVPVKILLTSKSIKGYENRLEPGLSTVVSVHVL